MMEKPCTENLKTGKISWSGN